MHFHRSVYFRYLLTLFLLILISASWYRFFYQPLQDRLLRVQAKLQGFYRAQSAQQDQQGFTSEKQEEVEHFKQVVQPYVSEASSGLWMQNQINLLLACASGQGLKIRSCGVDSEISKELWRVAYPLRLQLTGSLEQLQEFFKKIIESKQILSFKTLSISAAQEKSYAIELVVHVPKIKLDPPTPIGG